MSEEPRSTASETTRWTSSMTEESSPPVPKFTVAGVRSYTGVCGGGASASADSSGSSTGAEAPPPPQLGSPIRSRMKSMSPEEATAGRTS
jgi:hypothetical protein